ncbi:MAG: YolD-like family protein [Ruminococcaceae bacterium]|nr:YolD-like family protein [Oscillospiraceae bacterium]
MNNKKREKMSTLERAKQFAPFSPLSGLGKALREREKIYVAKAELSLERAEELSKKLAETEKGMYIKLVYYSEGDYISCEGLVSRIDKIGRSLTVVKNKIAFDDIYEICRIIQ